MTTIAVKRHTLLLLSAAFPALFSGACLEQGGGEFELAADEGDGFDAFGRYEDPLAGASAQFAQAIRGRVLFDDLDDQRPARFLVSKAPEGAVRMEIALLRHGDTLSERVGEDPKDHPRRWRVEKDRLLAVGVDQKSVVGEIVLAPSLQYIVRPGKADAESYPLTAVAAPANRVDSIRTLWADHYIVSGIEVARDKSAQQKVALTAARAIFERAWNKKLTANPWHAYLAYNMAVASLALGEPGRSLQESSWVVTYGAARIKDVRERLQEIKDKPEQVKPRLFNINLEDWQKRLQDMEKNEKEFFKRAVELNKKALSTLTGEP